MFLNRRKRVRKEGKAKALPKSGAKKKQGVSDANLSEFIVGADGSIMKAKLIDDVVNFICSSIEGVDEDKVEFPFVLNLLLVCIIYIMLGEVSFQKHDQDHNVPLYTDVRVA